MLHVLLTFKRECTLDLFFKIIIYNNLDYRSRGTVCVFLLHNYATFNFLYKNAACQNPQLNTLKSSTWHAEILNLTR